MLRHHGDVDARPGLLDFAVNVRGSAPPEWLRARLVARLADLGRYPSAADDRAAREAVAARHGRDPDEVLLLAGAAEGFAMLPRLAPRLAAVLHPSFTEPELALREGGVEVTRVVLEPPYTLDSAEVPASADMVVLGNPTNPTSVLHPTAAIEALRRPGRLVVVDEAFADATFDPQQFDMAATGDGHARPDPQGGSAEPESLAHLSAPDLLVFRSLTKTWALAGLRCGYVLGHPDVLARLAHGRPHWPLGTLQLEAIIATASPEAVAEARQQAQRIAIERTAMVDRLTNLGVDVHTPATGPFLLLRVPNGDLVRKRLADNGIAVRRADTFPGLTPDHLRVAVRAPEAVDHLIDALKVALW
ncbi:Rv2231c family pyridoxal phosphate-dependent protein CobC [Nocardia camponoti]